ncbi:MAG TPA: ArsA-related P-loop ATPase, partial [Acidimicrobiales bacterium]|nr:ArsA-related P-loop ATPase [Acidimicrobiales bacterium]
STTAAALALLGATRGRRTLACEVDDKGDLADFYETSRPGFEPHKVASNLWVMTMDTEASLREYLHLQLRLPNMARLGPLARVFDFVSSAAPGVREILTVGKIGWEVRERHYDLVVVDAPATGHIVGQLTAPQAINDLVRVGQVREQTGWLADLLADPDTTGLVVVTTPEEMPVNETIELVRKVRAETRIDVAAIVVNRVLPELFSGADEAVFERLSEPELSDRLADAVKGPVAPVLEAARLAVTLRRTRAGHLDHLRSSLDAGVPLLYVPYLFARGHGLRTTGQVAEALSAELGY